MKKFQDTRILIILFAVCWWSSKADFESCTNTPKCICKWSGGKQSADCSYSGISSVPRTLSSDIQSLVLDGNPIDSLDKGVFNSSGLVNLQRISFKGCFIRYVDRHAFRGLKNLVEVDMSKNLIDKLPTNLFEGNDELKIVRFAKNPLTDLQANLFSPLKNLRTIDFSNCSIQHVNLKAFQNLGSRVDTILLHENKLRRVDVETFVSLKNLNTLQLHSNPWQCDCELNSFREWLRKKDFDLKSTTCLLPKSLQNRTWDTLSTKDFACRPKISIPKKFVYGSAGANVTLACLVVGNPKPRVDWKMNGQVLDDTRVSGSDQRVVMTSGKVSGEENQAWHNLTLLNFSQDVEGDYVCAAENDGGKMERTVQVGFEEVPKQTRSPSGGLRYNQWTLLIGVTTAAILFIGSIIALSIFCRKRKNYLIKGSSEEAKTIGGNSSILYSAYGNGNDETVISSLSRQITEESDALLLSHHQRLHRLNRDYEVFNTPISRTLLSNRATPESFYSPDPLDNSRGVVSSVQQNSVRLTSTPLSQMQTGSDCFHRIGNLTLPRHYHYRPHHYYSPQHSSRVSFDQDGQSAKGLRQAHQMPPVHYHHPLANKMAPAAAPPSKHPRPGYVTLPRKPRVSSNGPQGLILKDRESYHIYDQLGRKDYVQEPIYDGIGPRTTADGSSTLPRKLGKKSSKTDSEALDSGEGRISSTGYDESRFASPKLRPHSTPNILDLDDGESTSNLPSADPGNSNTFEGNVTSNANSEITLLEENLSGYCEPFGTALIDEDNDTPSPKSGPLTHENATNSLQENEVDKSGENDLNAVEENLYLNQQKVNGSHILESESESLAKVAPKTLPKPKIRPIPAPKPRFSTASAAAPVIENRFQDETVDGSEV